jgi:hypothetical protein
MNRALAPCCLLMTLLSFASPKTFAQAPQTAASPTAQISLLPKLDAKVIGTVLDPNGVPLEGCLVYAFTDGSSPPRDVTVATDFNGNFSIDVYSGHVLLFAYKESDLYHNNIFRFDAPAGTVNQAVDVRPGETVRGFVLHLPRQSALLRLDVYNADTNDPVYPVEYDLCREDHAADPTYCMYGKASDPGFQIVIPPDAISIKIVAHGYDEWRYQDANTGSSYLTLKQTEKRSLAVYLHPTIFNVSAFEPAYPQPDLYSRYLAQHNELYERLVQPSETNSAAAEIVQLAKNDPAARDFLASKLPSLIIDQLPTGGPETASPVWLNAVRLTGQLKLVAAIPALKHALSIPQMFGGYDDKYHGAATMTIVAKLGYDIVGRALADIGDPSVPVLKEYLQQTADPGARKRAVSILVNIDSPASRKAMEDQIFIENDPMVRGLIESAVPYGSVAGVVVDPQGKPVDGAHVYSIGTQKGELPLAGRYPPPGPSTKTDRRGKFVLVDVVPDNPVRIYASKESDYYADNGALSMFLLPQLIPEVEVKPGQTVNVTIQLAPKVGRMHLYVRDADTKKLVPGIFAHYCRKGEPEMYGCGEFSGGSEPNYLISPSTEVSIQIEADDGLHEKWEYRNPKTGSRYFQVKSGETETVNVYLRKK